MCVFLVLVDTIYHIDSGVQKNIRWSSQAHDFHKNYIFLLWSHCLQEIFNHWVILVQKNASGFAENHLKPYQDYMKQAPLSRYLIII